MNKPAKEMYMKALEKYQFANNARKVISKMREQ
jgi:hypothetical protein